MFQRTAQDFYGIHFQMLLLETSDADGKLIILELQTRTLQELPLFFFLPSYTK